MGRRTEGEPVKDDIDERFDDVEEPELREAGAFQHRTSLRSKERDCATHDGPVSQPLHVIPRARALQRLEGKVSGHDPAEDGGEEAGGDVEEDEQGEEGGEAEDAVGFRDLGLLFQPLEGGVLRQLRAPILVPSALRSLERSRDVGRTSLSICETYCCVAKPVTG